MTPADSAAPSPHRRAIVQLLGAPRLLFGRDAGSALDRKSAALLALAHIEPGITRSTAARWLWPDSDGPTARANLRVLLFRLTKLAGQVLITPGNFVALESHVLVGDEMALLHAIAESHGQWVALPSLLEGIDVDDLPEFQAWLERARRRIASRIDAALRERIAELEEAGELPHAAALAERLIEFDPNQESAYRELMRLQIARGERSAALAAFERCRAWLSEQLGVSPAAATLALHAQALRIDAGAALPPAMRALDAGDAQRPVLELCRRVERIMGERAGDRAELERLVHAVALRLPSPELSPDQLAYACGIVARHHLRAGRNADAASWSDQSIAAARHASAERLCWALGQRANLAVEAFDVGLACELLAEAERVARQLEQADKLSRVWHQIGTMLLAAGLLEQAECAMRRSLALHEAIGESADEEAVARLPAMRINLAACLMDQQRYSLAEAVLDRSLLDLDRHRGLRFRELRLVALLCLAYIHRIEDRLGQARTSLALARAEIDDTTMQRNRLFADLYEQLVAQAEAGRPAAQRALDWATEIDCPDALRIHLLRDLAAMCRHDGFGDIAQHASEHEARLRVARCRAVQRGQGRRWLREFGGTVPADAAEAAAPASPPGTFDLDASTRPASGHPAAGPIPLARNASPTAPRSTPTADDEPMPPELDVVERMSMLAELRSGRDGRHGARVGELAGRLARELGVPETLARRIAPAARLHDIGKAVLDEPHAAAEPGTLRARHAELGAMLLSGQPSPVARLAETIAQQHHEHWDGSGGPLGLAGASIALPARIVAVADLYDHADHDDAHRDDDAAAAALARARALERVEAAAGTLLDPQLAAAFVRMMRRPGQPARAAPRTPNVLAAAARLLGALSAG